MAAIGRVIGGDFIDNHLLQVSDLIAAFKRKIKHFASWLFVKYWFKQPEIPRLADHDRSPSRGVPAPVRP
jgi:hypothetical protein